MTDPISLDLAEIRARAEAATKHSPGSWRVEPDFAFGNKVDGSVGNKCIGFDIHCEARRVIDAQGIMEDAEVVAAYIAGMDPPTTLALVDEVERLTRRVAELEATQCQS